MGLSHQQLVDLANEMMKFAEEIACRKQEGIGTQDIERVQHWRDMIAEQVYPRCAAVYELDVVIESAQRVVDLRGTERVAVATLRIALILAAAVGALVEVGRDLYFAELFGE